MRLLFTLTFSTFFLLFTSSLMAQSPWEPVAVPQGEYVPNQLILRFSSTHDASRLQQDIETEHGVQLNFVRQINDAGTDFLIEVRSGIDQEVCQRTPADYTMACTMCEIIGNPGSGGPMGEADGVWPNYIGSSGQARSTSTHPEYAKTAIFPDGNYDPLVQCDQDTELPFVEADGTTRTVKIGIMDSGIAPAHFSDFFGSHASDPGSPIVHWKPLWASPIDGDLPHINTDPNGHGTAVAFLAAHDIVNNNLQDRLEVVSLRVLDNDGRGTLVDALRALDVAAGINLDVLNMSFGFREMDCDLHASTIFDGYFDRFLADQVAVLVSAGNDGVDLSSDPQWPASENEYLNVFTVGANTCNLDTRWGDSNFHPAFVDLMAPGTNIAVPYTNSTSVGEYVYASGTSFAAPLAASVVASYILHSSRMQAHCVIKSAVAAEPQYSHFGSILDLDIDICPPNSPGDFRKNQMGKPQEAEALTTTAKSFPNPFTSLLYVETIPGNKEVSRVELIDNTGRIISSIQSISQVTKLDVANVKPGVYYVRTTDANGTTVNKVIKQ